jgi:hypothetical protein
VTDPEPDPEPEIKFHRATSARIKEAIMESNRTFEARGTRWQARGTRWQARRHWTSYLEPAIIIAALVGLFCTIVWGLMGCSSDGPPAGGRDGGPGDGGRDGGAAVDGGGTDGRAAVDAGRVPDGGVLPADGGALVVDGGALPPDGGPVFTVSWTGVYTLTWTLISNTCSSPEPGERSLFARFTYTEPAMTASWSSPGTIPVAAELARDFSWLRTSGYYGYLQKSTISTTTWVQGPPFTITGQSATTMKATTGSNPKPECTTTWGVKGVRP